MKEHVMRRAAAVIVAAALLGGSAEALFQRKADQTMAAEAPTARDLEIQTYRDLPIQGRLPAAAGEGEMTYALAKESSDSQFENQKKQNIRSYQTNRADNSGNCHLDRKSTRLNSSHT